MANLSETTTYDVGVYQLETADPVTGGAAGIANAPLKNLANRTNYLKTHIDTLETNMSGYAPLASPGLTGSPTAPTQALGDNSTKIANDAFVQATLGGVLTKSVAGGSNVTLSAVEAGNGILIFTGLLTANIAVIVPTSPTRGWIVRNSTTGAFSLTIKTAAGTGVVIGSDDITAYTDGVNVLYQHAIVPQAEAEAGTATTERGWSAQRVKQAIVGLVIQATETIKGIAEIATQTETNDGIDDLRIVTPLKLKFGFAYSFAQNGYIKFPTWLSGFVIQWGTEIDSTFTFGSVSYPIAFPNACLFRTAINDSLSVTTPDHADARKVVTCYDARLTTSFNWNCVDFTPSPPIAAYPAAFTWIAIGN